MQLQMKRLWHLEQGEMFYKPEPVDRIDIRAAGVDYIKCYDINGIEKSFPWKDTIVDIQYATTLVDDNLNEIISGDVIDVKFILGSRYRVAIIKHKVDRNIIFDFYPQILSPSLGIAYLLSRNVESIKIIGHMYEDPSKFGGLG